MRISILTTHLTGHGGTETVVKKFLNGFQNKKKYQMRLVIDGDSDDKSWLNEIAEDVRIKIFRSHNNFFKLAFAFFFLLRTNDEIVIITDTRLLFIAKLVKKILLRKYVLISWMHFSLVNSNVVNINFLKNADYHFAISSGISRQLQAIGINKSRIFTIFNPTEKVKNLIYPCNSKTKKHFVYVGRIQFEGQKNIKLLLDSLAIAHDNWQLDVYGDGIDLEKCRAYSGIKGLEEKINWHGWVNNPWDKIKRCDGLLLSSTYEGFPMILLEALAHGVPCISTNCPTGPEDLIQNDINGFLVKSGSAEEMKNAINKILTGKFQSNPKDIAASMQFFYDAQYFNRVDEIFKKLN